MPVFKNLESLLNSKYFKNTLKDIFQNEVVDKVREVEQKHIQSDVYDTYVDGWYERRENSGGLIAGENIIGEMVGDLDLSVRNISEPNESAFGTPYTPINDTDFASWIENGKVVDWWNDSNDVWTQPREFTKNTINELRETSEHIDAVKQGLKKRGFSVR